MLPKTRVVELVVVLIALAVLIGTKSINNHFKDKMIVPIPIELILVILATIITHYAGLIDKYGVTVVGAIPSGFRAPVIPDASYFPSIAGDAFSLAIVSYTINIALAKTFALKHGYKVDNNQEMIAVGLSNGIGSFFFCFNVSSSLARSLVQDSTGCKTQVTGVVSSIVMMIVILKIGSLFQELPVAVLAAIVLVNLTLLFMQFTDVYTLWKTNKIDMVVWLVTFACTILLNLDIGLAAAVGFSLFVYIIRSQLPRYYILGLVPDTALYLDIETYKEAKEIPGIKIFSTSATLYHINAQRFTEALEKKTGFDLEKLLTTKRKRDEALKRKEEKEIKKAKKLAKNQNQLNRRLFSGIFALKKSKIEEGGFPAELSGQNQVNLTDFKQAGISTIDLGTGQVNWAYQHDLGPGDNNLPPVTYHGDEDKGSSSESRTHSIILDISKTSFVDINTVNVLKKIFSDFGELDVAIYLSGCQACVVKQLDTAGFFSEQIPKSRLFVTVHDAVLYVLKTQTQKDVILDVPCYTQM